MTSYQGECSTRYVKAFQIKFMAFIGHFLRKSVKDLDDLEWETFSDDLDYITYSMNEDQKFSYLKEQCLYLNATLLAIPKDTKSMFYFLKTMKRLSESMNYILIFMDFEKEDMPNIVHEVYKFENLILEII